MALYQYESIDSKGKIAKGWVHADSISEAKQTLFAKKVVLTKLKQLGQKECPSLKKQDLLNLTGELSKLLRAGLPLYESLLALEERYQNHTSHLTILSLCDQIKNGHSLSSAMRKHPQSFDALYCSMIANAEKSGTLLEALEEIYELLKKQQNLKKQIINALLYPGILTVFCCIVISALLYFVIPSLFELFEGKELHPFTSFVLSVSQYAIRYKAFVLVGFIGFLCVLASCVIFSSMRRFCLRQCSKLWGIKTIFLRVALIRFSRTCGTMLKEGIPLVEALRMSKDAVGHPILEELLDRVELNVMEGKSFSEEFKKNPLIPKLFNRMLSIAEESGKTSSMLLQLSEIYEDELEKTFQHVTTIAQPVILLVLGGIVGLVLLSVLLPLTDVSSFIST